MRQDLLQVWKNKPKIVRLIKDRCQLLEIDASELELDQQSETGLQEIYQALYEHCKTVEPSKKIDDSLLELFALGGYIDATNGGKHIYGDNAIIELSRFYRVYKDVIPNKGQAWENYGSQFILSFTYAIETEERLVFGKLREMPLSVQNERETPKGSSLPSDWKSGFKSNVRFDLYSGRFEDCQIITLDQGRQLGIIPQPTKTKCRINFLPDESREDYHFLSTALTRSHHGAYYVLDHDQKRKIRIPDTYKTKQGEIKPQDQAYREHYLKRFPNASIVYLRNDQASVDIQRLPRIEATNAQLGYTQAVKKAKSKHSSGGRTSSLTTDSKSLAKNRTDHMVDLKSRSYTLPKVSEVNGRKLPRLKFNLNLSSCGSFIYYNATVETKLAAKVVLDVNGYTTIVPVALKVTPGSQDERIWECCKRYLGFATNEVESEPKYDELGNKIEPRGDSAKLQELKAMLQPHKPFAGIHQAKLERKAAKQKQRKLMGCIR